MTQKENVSNYLRLRLPRYRQTPLPLKRVKAHAIGVSISFTLVAYIKFGEFTVNKNQSGRFNVYVNQSLLFYHRRCSFIGSTFIIQLLQSHTDCQ